MRERLAVTYIFFVNKADEKNRTDSGISHFNSPAVAREPTASSENKKTFQMSHKYVLLFIYLFF